MKKIFIILLLNFTFLFGNVVEKGKFSLVVINLIPNDSEFTFQEMIRKNYNFIEKEIFVKYGKEILIEENSYILNKNVSLKKDNKILFLGEQRSSDLVNISITDLIQINEFEEKIILNLDIDLNKFYYYEANYTYDNITYKRIYQFKLESLSSDIFSF